VLANLQIVKYINVLQERNNGGMKHLVYMLSALSKLDIDIGKVDAKYHQRMANGKCHITLNI
jgi:hypothetical protein